MEYTNSALAEYIRLSPNMTSDKTHPIDTVTVHCAVCFLDVESLGEHFASKEKRVSSNYGIGSDGKIAMYVEEKNRSWCSSSPENDGRAVTIEVASEDCEPYAVSDKAFEALIRLLADICRRNGIKRLVWSENKDERVNHKNGCNMTVHRDFDPEKSCPGTYLYERHGEIARRVNALI